MMQLGLSEVRRVRRWRSVSEKRQIVQLTMEAGASVAEIAREHGLNANQVFKWRRAFERGELEDSHPALLPVTLSTSIEAEDKAAKLPADEQPHSGGSIYVELPGRALIHFERGADPDLVRSVLQSVCK
jgi:transposase